jgi:site-specific recombinase XerC
MGYTKPRHTKPKRPRTVLRLLDLEHSKSAVLNSLAAVSSQESYGHAIDEFITWYCSEPRLSLSRTVVRRYRIYLEQRNLSASTINVRLAAVRRLAYEAADNGLLSPELAAGIRRVKGAKRLGVRIGNWISVEQARTLLNDSFPDNLRGKRDRAMISILLGCGLRRAEAVGLTTTDLQMRESHWVITDLIGKGKRIRTVPVPNWAKAALDEWITASGIVAGRSFAELTRMGEFGAMESRLRRFGLSSKLLPNMPGYPILRRTICVVVAHDCATWLAASWNRFSFCSDMLPFRQPNATWLASKNSIRQSTTEWAWKPLR